MRTGRFFYFDPSSLGHEILRRNLNEKKCSTFLQNGPGPLKGCRSNDHKTIISLCINKATEAEANQEFRTVK